jgi:hypothetical protein
VYKTTTVKYDKRDTHLATDNIFHRQPASLKRSHISCIANGHFSAQGFPGSRYTDKNDRH